MTRFQPIENVKKPLIRWTYIDIMPSRLPTFFHEEPIKSVCRNQNARDARAFEISLLADNRVLGLVGRLPGHSLNIGTADADIGQLTVAQTGQLVEAAIVLLPLMDEADKGGKH